MGRVVNIQVDMLQDLVLKDTLYPLGTKDSDIDRGIATPDNIAGRSYECVIHRAPGDGLQLQRYATSGSGMTFPNGGADGQVWTAVPLADLQSLGPGDFVYYIRRTDAGVATVVTKGEFSLGAV